MSTPVLNKGHVCFGSEDYIPGENSVVVRQTSPNLVQIHLGFLQYYHIYEVSFDVPKLCFSGYDIHTVSKAAEHSGVMGNSKVITVEDRCDFYEFQIEFQADRERFMKDEILLRLDQEFLLKLEVSARVLGPGKGTPFLKNGVRCIGTMNDSFSDDSEKE